MLVESQIAGAAFALGAAVFWGGADFSGGVGAKGAHPALVVAVSQGAGFLCLLAFVLVIGESLPSHSAVVWGAASGVGAGLGNLCFYRALAIGKMGINAPVAAVVTSALAVLYSAILEGAPTPLQLGGFAVAAVAIWLMTFSSGETKGLALAIGGGLGFSLYLTCSKHATVDSVYWPLVVARITAVAIFVPVLISMSARRSPGNWSYMIAAGMLDAIANALFVYSAKHGRLDVATVLSAFYPAGTVLLARIILKEQVTRWQATGIVGALVAIPMIASH